MMNFITAKEAYEQSLKNSTLEEEKGKIAAEVFEEINKSIQNGRFTAFCKPSKTTPEYTDAIIRYLHELLTNRGFFYEITKVGRHNIANISIEWGNSDEV